MSRFHSRQAAGLGVVIVALLVAMAASVIFRGLVIPVVIGPPMYLNPGILFAIVLIGGVGLLTMFPVSDAGYPWFLAVIGLWIFIVAIEDSLLAWFTFQLGAATSGGRINPLAISASVVAVAAATVMHANQLGRRLRLALADRGIDPRELDEVEDRAFQAAITLAAQLAGLIAGASVLLFVGEFVLGRASLGIGALGILGAIVIVGVIALLAYGVLREGPIPEEPVRARPGPPGARRPPSGPP